MGLDQKKIDLDNIFPLHKISSLITNHF